MKPFLTAAAFALFASTLHAETLTFDDATCNGGVACSDGLVIDQSHGDTSLVDITYDGDFIITDGLQPVFWWSAGFEDFGSGIYTDVFDTIRVDLIPVAGYELAVTRVGVAPFENSTTSNGLTIEGRSIGRVAGMGYSPLSRDGNTFLSPDTVQYDADGYSVFFGAEAVNAGIGSIEYEVRLIGEPMAPIPLPAAAWMLLAGLGALRGARRFA